METALTYQAIDPRDNLYTYTAIDHSVTVGILKHYNHAMRYPDDVYLLTRALNLSVQEGETVTLCESEHQVLQSAMAWSAQTIADYREKAAAEIAECEEYQGYPLTELEVMNYAFANI